MRVLRCFFLLDSASKIPGSRVPVGSLELISLRKRYYFKLLSLHIPYVKRLLPRDEGYGKESRSTNTM